jgi:nucleoside-diphosphate-sugar epimerase
MPLSGNILVTGGSGTLGRAIVRTAERENWDCSITIYSRSELRQAQMRAKHPRCRYVLGDVRDYDRLAAVAVGHDLVIHARGDEAHPRMRSEPRRMLRDERSGQYQRRAGVYRGGGQAVCRREHR